ncbi:tetratricopeptide repeat protein [Galbibacter mesophilus]|uniref:tetratricopeptide repeat protein n=1 Tax=Galbibacter mesophilus TaxID=379069 RepID=UPI00191E5C22|nr:tetratricopeptide repeat protein [Galbibacter mesophilus]MCM5661746.1 tetratricopeptide repeat protein [Galbibacter mesophilus]
MNITNLFCVLFFLLSNALLSAQNNVVTEANVLISENKINEAKELLISSYKKQKNPKVTERLGDVYGIEDNWDEASKYYKELVDTYPENAVYHFKYGGVLGMIALESKIRALSVLGDVKKHFKKAAELDPDHLDVRWASVDLYLKLPGILGGSTNKSRKYSKELASIVPLEGHLSRAFIEMEEGNEELAEVYNKRALDIAFNNSYPTKSYKRPDIHFRLGKVSAQHNYKTETGIKHLLIYEELHTPESIQPKGNVFYYLAKLYRLQKNKEKALFYIQKAKEEGNSSETVSEEASLIEKM